MQSWDAYEKCTSPGADSAAQGEAYQCLCAAAAAAAACAGDGSAAAWSATAEACVAVCSARAEVPAAGGFQWVDGILLEAMAAGEWVLLDNANLCSPTVLDRLNPLLEPGGELLIPEAGLVKGAPRVAIPAPGFRLLLALDPRHGEVSRAMRNRGIEVFLLPAETHQVRACAICARATSAELPSACWQRRLSGHCCVQSAAILCAH